MDPNRNLNRNPNRNLSFRSGFESLPPRAMAKKNRPRRRKSKPARAAPVAQAFPASVAAAEFLAICSEAARRGDLLGAFIAT